MALKAGASFRFIISYSSILIRQLTKQIIQ
jgi:hypothetical protein